MSLRTFDNAGGVGDGLWSTASNWSGGVKPIAGDYVSIEADCVCDSDESAAILSGDHSHVTSGVTLSVATGGTIYYQGKYWYVDNGGTLELDGGTIRGTYSGGEPHLYVNTGGVLAWTSNGGTVEVDTTSSNTRIWLKGSITPAGDGTRLTISGHCGSNYGKIYVDVADATLEDLDCDGVYWIEQGQYRLHIENCLVHAGQYGLRGKAGYTMSARGCWIYNALQYGLDGLGRVSLVDVVFGKTEADEAAANTAGDVYVRPGAAIYLVCCTLASTTPVTSAGVGDLISDCQDGDPRDWQHWEGYGHYALPVFGSDAHGGSGTAVQCVSSSGCADTDPLRYRRLVAAIPATHGDTLDLTLYVYGATGDNATLRIGTDAGVGTEQTVAVAGNDAWQQKTLPTFTVDAGGAGNMCAVPVYLDITGASETWRYDTLEGDAECDFDRHCRGIAVLDTSGGGGSTALLSANKRGNKQ